MTKTNVRTKRTTHKSALQYKPGTPRVCGNCEQDAYYCDGTECESSEFVVGQAIICKKVEWSKEEKRGSMHFCKKCYQDAKVVELGKDDKVVG